ncbi:hypothetical protein [Paraburkholderia sp. GAS348]|uniref:hypothetical protein n=1 Tax=Paraburkholderia sp. GAS348 TaxID=3035132 RepID=UPI003D1F7DFB
MPTLPNVGGSLRAAPNIRKGALSSNAKIVYGEFVYGELLSAEPGRQAVDQDELEGGAA